MGLIEHDEHDDPIATTEWAIKVLSAGAAPIGRRLHAREELRRLAQQHAGAVSRAERAERRANELRLDLANCQRVVNEMAAGGR